MSRKKVVATINMILKGGEASINAAVSQAFAGRVSSKDSAKTFCTDFNEKTKNRKGEKVPVTIKFYEDKEYSVKIKEETASTMLLKAVNAQKGSGTPNKIKIGTISKEQLKEIAIKKMPDLNTKDIEKAMKTIAGTARNMGISIE